MFSFYFCRILNIYRIHVQDINIGEGVSEGTVFCFFRSPLITKKKNPQWEGTQEKSTIVPFAGKQWIVFLISKIMSDLNLLSVFFNASRFALESSQNKIDKNEYGKSTNCDNDIKIAHSKNKIPFSNMKLTGFFLVHEVFNRWCLNKICC